MFERNVGGLDRIARGVVGTCLVAVAFGAFLAGRRSMDEHPLGRSSTRQCPSKHFDNIVEGIFVVVRHC